MQLIKKTMKAKKVSRKTRVYYRVTTVLPGLNSSLSAVSMSRIVPIGRMDHVTYRDMSQSMWKEEKLSIEISELPSWTGRR